MSETKFDPADIDAPVGDSSGGATSRASDGQVAVALDHETGNSELPRVVASGKGEVARQILEIAFAHGVKVREDADLAEILGAIDVESEIPLEAIAAVAEILSYVYRANGMSMDGKDNGMDGENNGENNG